MNFSNKNIHQAQMPINFRGTILQSEIDTIKRNSLTGRKYENKFTKVSYVTVNMYVSELIDNENGKFDSLESAWLTVPTEWAENQITLQEFESLEVFFDEYTYDDTDGWLQKAVNDGILLGCGIGLDSELSRISEELEQLQELENVAVEDMNFNEIDIMSLNSAKDKYISLRLADEDYKPTEVEKALEISALKNIDSKSLGERLECYGFMIR